ncbi:hypothetical protein FOA43_002909 [Brettanomyces nanus]|uniref:Ureidoglycolate lyase n=1 Tax=Eeniella nana TaxID=13502 RepID=A0A875S8Z4_EENNA|nr:uncharacterized protein FOA43_002909 [Brettanomyces nanus]QPG75554.1 hypothetical protein FOA43_002909 [Brettanomyces nanus]
MVVVDKVKVTVDSARVIEAEMLTPKSFATFGSVFSADEQIQDAEKTSANQGTATKLLKVAPVINNSEQAPSGRMATANWNIFRSYPPNHLMTKDGDTVSYLARVLERHPYTTQTFIPMGLDAHQIGFLVICAPNDTAHGNLPDYRRARAFLCRGDQSVTYGVGTWHAPMVALGPGYHLDFAVLVHENGVPNEDCEEVLYEPGFHVSYVV